MISCSSWTASSAPATSAKVVFGRVLGDELRLRLAEVEHPAAAALHLRHEQQQQDHQHRDRQQVDQEAEQDAVLGEAGVEGLDLVRRLEVVQLGEDLVGRLGRAPCAWMWSVCVPLTSIFLFRSSFRFCSRSSSSAFFTLPLRSSVSATEVSTFVYSWPPVKKLLKRDGADDHQDDPHEWPAEDPTGTFHAILSAFAPSLPISQSILPRRRRGTVAGQSARTGQPPWRPVIRRYTVRAGTARSRPALAAPLPAKSQDESRYGADAVRSTRRNAGLDQAREYTDGSKHPDVGHLAVALGEVQAVPDDELVRDVEADVPDRHVHLAPRPACAAVRPPPPTRPTGSPGTSAARTGSARSRRCPPPRSRAGWRCRGRGP